MTVFLFYTVTMQFQILKNLLLAPAILGILWLVVLFGVCFLAVHIAKLVKCGWLYQKKEDPPKPTEEKKEKAPEPKPSAEPVYYIVERKRKTRQSYGEPKQIRFK